MFAKSSPQAHGRNPQFLFVCLSIQSFVLVGQVVGTFCASYWGDGLAEWSPGDAERAVMEQAAAEIGALLAEVVQL